MLQPIFDLILVSDNNASTPMLPPLFDLTRIVPVRCYGQHNICIAIHTTSNEIIKSE
jgi:hypothetical protein